MSRFGEVGGVSPYGGKAGGGDAAGPPSARRGKSGGEGTGVDGSEGDSEVNGACTTGSPIPSWAYIAAGSSPSTLCGLPGPGIRPASTLAFMDPASHLLPADGPSACHSLSSFLSWSRHRLWDTAARRRPLLITSSSAEGGSPRCSNVISLMTAALYLSSDASAACAVPGFEVC